MRHRRIKRALLTHNIRVSEQVYKLCRRNGKLWHKSASRYLDDEVRRLVGSNWHLKSAKAAKMVADIERELDREL